MGRLLDEATWVRQMMQAKDRPEWRIGNLACFPKDCCDHGMRLLALHLYRLGYSGFKRAKGERPGQRPPISHVWLKWRGINLDITADQFTGEGCSPIIVARRSDWHEAWNPIVSTIYESKLIEWRDSYHGVFEVYRQILATWKLEDRS